MGDASKLVVSVPPRASFEGLFTGGFSPGPMTLVSSFFSDPDNCSFSQLLAGAMASPIAKPNTSFMLADNRVATTSTSSSGEKEKEVSGYKQNRPMGLVVAQSPLFMVPPGLTPSGLLNSPGFISPLQSPFGMSHQQALAHVTAQAALSQSYMQLQDEFQRSSLPSSAEASKDQSCSLPNENLSHQINSDSSEPIMKIESPEISQSDRKVASCSVDKLENDGYNWRKYGQKQVKASEHPRSYYRCTHLSCPVKKKVERSLDGHVTEITYKGQHNHDPPQPNKWTKDGSGQVGVSSSQTKVAHGLQGQNDNPYVLTELAPRADQVSVQTSSGQLPVTSGHDGLQDTAIVVKEDDDVDEPDAKRRCSDIGVSALGSSHKTVTESRIIVQTRSEVDLLDDGYKWRKYGQKVVKGNPYPRSYYRCTYTGCNVRKYVERASADPKAVITTYEGKHNHDIPTAKNSSSNTGKSSAAQLKSQKMITGERSLHTGMDFESKDQIPVLPQLKGGEIAA